MINKNIYNSVILLTILLSVVNNAVCASRITDQPHKPTFTEHTTIKQINRFLSGQSKEFVSIELGELTTYDYISIRESIDGLLNNTNNILWTSYRESSKEYRKKCNFLMISVSLESLLEKFNELDECKDDCSDVQLAKIKRRIKYEYDYLTLKSSSCSQLLGIK